MKKITLSASIIFLLSAMPVSLTAEQGDVAGFFTVTLESVSNEVVVKQCGYRANIIVLKDNRYGSDRVYGITMNTGVVAQVPGQPSWVKDTRFSQDRDPLKIGYTTTVVRFSDCPESIRLKYNSLTKEIRKL